MAPEPGASRLGASESDPLQARSLPLCSVTSPWAALPGWALPLPTLHTRSWALPVTQFPSGHRPGAEEEQQQVKN